MSTHRSNPRKTNGHRRRQIIARVLAAYNTCHLCGRPVDKTLPAGLPGSPEVDELIPVSKGGSPYQFTNCYRTPMVQPHTQQPQRRMGTQRNRKNAQQASRHHADQTNHDGLQDQ